MIKIKLTDDHLKLISNLRMGSLPSNKNEEPIVRLGFDLNSLYGGSFILEDISFILGCYDKHIEGTEAYVTGPVFPKEMEDYMYSLHFDVINNIEYIEELVHTFINKGGLVPGTYQCNEWEHVWTKID